VMAVTMMTGACLLISPSKSGNFLGLHPVDPIRGEGRDEHTFQAALGRVRGSGQQSFRRLSPAGRDESKMTREEIDELMAIEQRAIQLQTHGQYLDAIPLWEELVAAAPKWDHGSAWHSLAACCEDAGEFQEAEVAYLRAIEIEPSNWIYIGGYASFLYLHGEANEAFEQHLRLIRTKLADGVADAQNRFQPVLDELGRRLGLNQPELDRRIQENVEPALRGICSK